MSNVHGIIIRSTLKDFGLKGQCLRRSEEVLLDVSTASSLEVPHLTRDSEGAVLLIPKRNFGITTSSMLLYNAR